MDACLVVRQDNCQRKSRMRIHYTALALIVAAASMPACGERDRESGDAGAQQPVASARACTAPGVRTVVETLGQRMQLVSLLAPDTIVSRALADEYMPLVTAALLARWQADPASAPGRTVSSPWPARIEIDAVESAGPRTCRVTGAVVYVASAEDTTFAEVAREAVVVEVVEQDDGWRIADYATAADPATLPEDTTSMDIPPADAASTDAAAAVAVLEQYYAAIDEGDYRTAYALWSDGGASSGQTFDEFAAGYENTASVRVEAGKPGRVEGAAGSRYVVIPVVVHATTSDGTPQRFVGGYTLRRSVVDGATAEQRNWRIYSAEVQPADPR